MGRQERNDRMVMLGIRLLAQQGRQEDYLEEKRLAREERAGLRKEEARRYGVQEKRQARQEARQVELGKMRAKEYAWKKADYKKKKNYEVVNKKLETGRALIQAGREREGNAMLVDAYNKGWPDGNEAQIIYRSDKPDSASIAKWDSDPNLAGKNIAILSPGTGLVGFKTNEEFQNYISSWVNPKEYLRVSRESEAKVASLNAKEKPFRAEDGHAYIRTWELDSGGNPKRGPVKPYEEKMAAPKRTEVALKAKEAEKVLGRPLTTQEKRVTLGLAEKEKKERKKAPDISKQRKAEMDDLKTALMPFAGKEKDVFDDITGELTRKGETALNIAFTLVEKDEAGKPLTPKEKRNLPKAKLALMVYSQISGRIAEEYTGEEPTPSPSPIGGNSWSAYDIAPQELVPAHRRPILGNQRAN